jgi:hypothetical protein
MPKDRSSETGVMEGSIRVSVGVGQGGPNVWNKRPGIEDIVEVGEVAELLLVGEGDGETNTIVVEKSIPDVSVETIAGQGPGP